MAKSAPSGLFFKTDSTTLRGIIARVSAVVERRNTVPITSCVLLSAKDGRLTVTGTDIMTRITQDVPGAGLRDGACAVYARTLNSLVSKFPKDAVVELECGGENDPFVIRCGNNTSTLFAMAAEDYPVHDVHKFTHKFIIGGPSLFAMIDKVRFAISTEETRYYLNGIHFHAADNDGVKVFRSVTTDGHRMALMEMPMPDGGAGAPSIILPTNAATHLWRALAKYKGDVEVASSDTRARAEYRIPGLTIHAKLIDGTFPDYQRAIPRNNDRHLVISGSELPALINRVSALSSERSRPVKLTMSENSLTAEGRSPEDGSSVETLNGGSVQWSGVPLVIGFQARYLNDILKAIGPEITMKFSDNNSPAIVVGHDPAFTSILMPMRV